MGVLEHFARHSFCTSTVISFTFLVVMDLINKVTQLSVRLDDPVRYCALSLTQPLVALNYISALIKSEYFFAYIAIFMLLCFVILPHHSSFIIPVANLCPK